MGCTIHWIDDMTLKRVSKPLCLRRFCYPHTNDRIAEKLISINQEFDIHQKIIGTVTDSEPSVVAAFTNFGISLITSYEQDENEILDNDDVDFEENDDFDFEVSNKTRGFIFPDVLPDRVRYRYVTLRTLYVW